MEAGHCYVAMLTEHEIRPHAFPELGLDLVETPLLPTGYRVPASRWVHPSRRMRELLRSEPYLFGPGMSERQEQAYIELQREEWANGADVPTRSHHFFSGVPYHHLVGELYGGSRLGQRFVEELPDGKVV